MLNIRTEACGEGGPVLYWIASPKSIAHADEMADAIGKLTENKPFVLASVSVQSWDDDLTPWTGAKPFGTGEYQGNGGETLKELVPAAEEARKEYRTSKCFIGGYSLAGLFSLWAFYESGAFDGAACCSGSLWYPGWDGYSQKAAAPPESIVYLSLGDREERTKNQLMAQVGDRTRRQYEILKQDKNIIRCNFELNSGGHFNAPEERMAKGFAWLLNSME